MITERTTYTPDSPEWADVIAELRAGDEVEAWSERGVGYRGAIRDVAGERVTGKPVSLMVRHELIRWSDGFANSDLTSLAVTKLAPREPSWAGAQVVLDKDGAPWQRLCSYWRAGGLLPRSAAEVDQHYGPITVLIDANGRVPVDSVLKINRVTRDRLAQALFQSLADRNVYAGPVSALFIHIDAILAALDGAR